MGRPGPRRSDQIELHAFDAVASALPPLLPAGPWNVRGHRWGIKVWRGPADVIDKEHYEAQVVGRVHVPAAETLALEVGFHAEHPTAEANERVACALAGLEERWRSVLGEDPVLAPFLGAPRWRRLSETWLDPYLDAPDLPFELTARLMDYLSAIEPLRPLGTAPTRRRTPKR